MANRGSNRIVGLVAVLGVPLTALLSITTNLVAVLFDEKRLKQHALLIVAILAVLALLEFIRKTVQDFLDRKQQRPDSPKVDRSTACRLKLIRLMRRRWVDEYLEKSLYKVAKIKLSIEEDAAALDNRPEMFVRSADRSTRPIGFPKDIHALLVDLGSFLLLGAAGGGKTTWLAEAVRDLIERAEKDSSVYPPVALRLADWTPKRGSIRDWVTSSLATDRIPIDVAQDWLARSDFVVLLDALDEVRANHRAECVAAINAFLAESPLTLVVSCRETDYEHLSTKLLLETAVFLRPLTRRAVDTAVSAAGPSLTNLKVALKWAPDLYNVLDSPLMLDIARISYASAGDLQLASSAPATPSDLRQRLFAVYVQRMIGSVSKTRASSKRMERTLTWIADNLRRREQTNFVKSSLVQLLWLPRSGDLASRAVREVGCVVGALIGLVLGSFLGALGAFLGRKVGVHFGSIAAIGGSIAAGGLAGTLGGEVCSIMARSAVEYEHIDQLWKDWKEGTFPLIKLFERLLAWVNRAWYFQALITIEHLAGAALYLFGLLLLALSVRTFPAGALIGLVLGACISAAANNGKRLRSFLAKESEQQRIPSLARKGSEHKAQSATTAGVDQLEKPAFPDSAAAQAVDSSAMKRLLRILNYLGLFFIIAAFLIAVPFILLLLQVDKIVAWLTERTQRYVIAWLLWREGVAPLDHGKFLDAATSRALLRLEVGSEVYRFIHPLLGAYFASCAVAKNRAAHL